MARLASLAPLLVSALLLAGCTEATTERTALSPVEEMQLVSPEDGSPPLAAEFTQDKRQIRGHLVWSESCQHALVVRTRSVELTTRRPMPGGAAAAGFGAVAFGAAGGGLLTHLDLFSKQQSCNTDSDGNEQCSSPHDDAAAIGVVLAAGAVALAVTSVATLTAKRSTTSGDQELGPPSAPRVVESGVACGHGTASDIPVSLEQGNARITQAISDDHGDVRFEIPDWLRGVVDIVVDQEPPGEPLVHAGDLIGRLEIAPPT